MRRRTVTLGTGLLALLAATAPVARANHTGYAGRCRFAAVNDATPGGQFGGLNHWNGEINVSVVATDSNGAMSGAPISAGCELLINGVSQGVMLAASGAGWASDAGPLSFTAEDTDVIGLCIHVTVDGEAHERCHDDGSLPDPVLLSAGVLSAVVRIASDFVPPSGGGGDPSPGFDVSASSIGLNTGEAGFELQFSDDLGVETQRAAGHAVTSTCAFRRGFVVGRTHLPRHQSAQEAYVSCRVIDKSNGQELYTREKWESGNTATFQEPYVHTASAVLICNRGQGRWLDGHPMDLGERCS
jgi:hypothetical protein